MCFLLYLLTTRYLMKRTLIAKSREFWGNIIPALPEGRFQQLFRMSKGGFIHIYEKIEHHPIFVNNSRCPQAPIRKQLAVGLRRFGAEASSGIAVMNIAE